MKKFLKLFLLLISITVLAGCNSKDKNMIEISLDDFKGKLANKESFVIYVGNDGCSACNSYMPTLESVIKEYNITIYHLDNSKLSSKEFAEFTTYLNISGTPTVAFIKNGEEETTLNRITGVTSEERTVEKFKTNGYIK